MRSADLRVALSDRTRHSRCTRDHSARNYPPLPPLAPCRFSGLLAMEVPTATWPTAGAEREIRRLIREMSLAKFSLGRSPHSWRTSQARHRYRSDFGCQVYGAAKATSVARLENVPSQLCGGDRL